MLNCKLGISQLEPVTTFTSLGFSLLQPHPVDAGGILFTYAAYQPPLVEGGDNCWVARISTHALVHTHVKVILKIK